MHGPSGIPTCSPRTICLVALCGEREKMDEERILRDALDLSYLVGCTADGRTPDRARVAAMDLEAVHLLASRHMLSAATAMALESAGFKSDWSSKAIASSLRKATIFEQALAGVKSELDKAGIWYAPLKGVVLKNYYPKYGMREFADHDILFDANRADDVKVIMEGLGFTTMHFGVGNHDVYYKAPVLNFEMHTALYGPTHDRGLYEYYQNVQGSLFGDGCEKRFSPEDFYLYLLSHEYKHYAASGTGLRSVLDTYVYLRAEKLDMGYVEAEAEKLGIGEFEERNRALAMHLFEDGELTEDDMEMLGYMIDSGTYGTVAHYVTNQIALYGRAGYLVRRAFPPLSTMAMLYPVLGRVPALLPACWAWRLLSAVATKPGKVAYQLGAAFRRNP